MTRARSQGQDASEVMTSFTQRMGRMARMASSLTGQVSARPRPTFQCGICFDRYEENLKVIFKKCGDENHAFCRDCIEQYCASKIEENRVQQIFCPADHQQGKKPTAEPDEVRVWLTDKDLLAKYERFRRRAEDSTLRECPSCKKDVKPHMDGNGEVIAEMKCACGQEFCYYHSIAHRGRSCEEYSKEQVRLERSKSGHTGLEGSLPCAWCGIATEKIAGCNHMTCKACSKDWCWRCGKKVENPHWHYDPNNPDHCQQFDGIPTGWRHNTGWTMFVLKVILFPVKLIFWVLLLVALIIFTILLIPVHLFGLCMDRRPLMSCAMCLSVSPFCLAAVIWTLFTCCTSWILVSCGAEQDHFLFVVLLWMDSLLDIMLCLRVRGVEQLVQGGGPQNDPFAEAREDMSSSEYEDFIAPVPRNDAEP